MSTTPKWTVSTYPKNIILKGEMMSSGRTAQSDTAEDNRKKAVYEHRLCYECRTVHILTGDHGKKALDDLAEEFNATDYTPKFDGQKLYFELTQAQREKIAFQSSPELPIQA